jgi:cyclopropane-fatty-acyl-phospholipid synthase
VVEEKWQVNGAHYQRTSDAWLARQDDRREEVLPILAEIYGAEDARLWTQRWRLFFLACSELFGYRQGNEWWVTHVRMASRGDGS